MKTLLLIALTILSLTDAFGENRLVFHGEFRKPLRNCSFYLYELSAEGEFVKAIYRDKVLEDGSITLKQLPEHYWYGVVSEDEYRHWWSNDSSWGTHLPIREPEMWIYVPAVGHVEIQVLNLEEVEGDLRCAISGEGTGKSFPISFREDGSFTIDDRRPGNHKISITSDDGSAVYYESVTFEIKRMSKTKLPPVTLAVNGSEPASKEPNSEQDGADQPATRPESKSEGGDKPELESEARPQ